MSGLLADSMVAIEITTDAAGDFTGYSPVVKGKIVAAIRFVNTDLAATLDLTITEEKDGKQILTQANQNGSATWYPTPVTNDPTDGSALTTVGVVTVGHSRIKLVAAQGGDTKTGIVYFDLK